MSFSVRCFFVIFILRLLVFSLPLPFFALPSVFYLLCHGLYMPLSMESFSPYVQVLLRFQVNSSSLLFISSIYVLDWVWCCTPWQGFIRSSLCYLWIFSYTITFSTIAPFLANFLFFSGAPCCCFCSCC